MVKRSDLSVFDDVRDVTGLKGSDRVLVYGNSFITGLSNGSNATTARRGKDLTRLSTDNQMFERIYITKDVVVSDVGILKLTAMNAGLLVFFADTDEDLKSFDDYFSFSYPWADKWVFDTNLGKVLVTSAKGPPDWMH